MSEHATQQLIAQILTFSANETALETRLRQFNDTDWENLVKIASAHLVLTTVYCRLKQKQLLHLLPQDLISYLQDLTAINRNRNSTIVAQINTISQLLQQHHINHVFLKAAALINAGYYKDLGERMLFDIDILIDKAQLKQAAQLITTLGYESHPITFGLKYAQAHNAPLLIPKKEGIAAVELHRHVLHQYSDTYLPAIDLLSKKIQVNNLYIPCASHLLSHIILNFEINDYGFNQNKLGFRNAYDFICGAKGLSIDELDKISSTSAFHALFIAKTGYFFKDVKSTKLTASVRFRYYFFSKSHENRYFKKLHDVGIIAAGKTKKTLRLWGYLIKRLIWFITNTNFRKEAWKDRRRVIKQTKAMFFD